MIPHPIELGGMGFFDVTPIKLKLKDKEVGLKKLTFQKYAKPPKVEEIVLKKRSLQAFEPSRELQEYDMTATHEWMPTPPEYKPYCSLREASSWKTEEDIEKDTEEEGAVARNSPEKLNSDENQEMLSDIASDDMHPCKKYFEAAPDETQEPFVKDFDFMKYLFADLQNFVMEKAPGVAGAVQSVKEVAGAESDGDAAENPADIISDALPQEVPQTADLPKLGLTGHVLDACASRQGERDLQEAADDQASEQGRVIVGAIHSAAAPFCSALPEVGAVLAPLGGGMETGVDFAEVCGDIADSTQSYADLFNEKHLEARHNWKLESDELDAGQCGGGESEAAQKLYKIYCDTHCMEDAVEQGNLAVLKSMRSEEKTMVQSVHSMLKFYTNEIFEKIKETQTQINHNDKQMSDILTDYVDQIMKQNTKYTVHLNKAIGDNVVNPLNDLQKKIITVNDNIGTVFKWLKEDKEQRVSLVREPDELPYADGKNILLHDALEMASNAAVKLVSNLHRRDDPKTIGLKEHILIPSLLKSFSQTKQQVELANDAMINGDVSKAKSHVEQVAYELQRASSTLETTGSNGARETASESFQRRSKHSIRPAHLQLLRETGSVNKAHRSLASFHQAQAAIMARASTLQELGAQAEHFAAAHMLVRFDEEILSTNRKFSQYLDASASYLRVRAAALKALKDAVEGSSCASSEALQQVGVHLAKLDRARKHHLRDLQRAWRDTADGLTRITNLVVDGGLLVHYVRLASLGLTARPNHIAKSTASVVDLQEPLRGSLRADAGSFMLQIKRAFTMGHHLAKMWRDKNLIPPNEELETLSDALMRIKVAAKDLRASLRPGADLWQQLLLRAAEGLGAGTPYQQFPPPSSCANAVKAVLWEVEPDSGAALLLTEAGTWLLCEPRSGQLTEWTPEGTRGNASNNLDLGDFLDVLI